MSSEWDRAWSREYSRRRYHGQRHDRDTLAAVLEAQGYQRPGRAHVTVHPHLRVLIEQAIARGEPTSRIMRCLTVDYQTVHTVRDKLDQLEDTAA